MPRIGIMMTALAALGCSGTEPSATGPGPEPSLWLTTLMTPIDWVDVSITGPGYAPAQMSSSMTYKAHAGGGIGPYYYTWKERWCFYMTDPNATPGYEYVAWMECQPDYSYGTTPTLSDSIKTFVFPENAMFTWLIVEVRESRDGGVTGVDSIEVLGPSQWRIATVPDGGSAYFKCSGGAHFWPEYEYVYDHLTHGMNEVPTGRKYRRNSCNGVREWVGTDSIGSRDTVNVPPDTSGS